MRVRSFPAISVAVILLACPSGPASAQPSADGASASTQSTVLPVVEVTATREPRPVDAVPAAITIISGEELRARGANDLRSALALAGGVEVGTGGDGGPASSVPAIWGLREFDAFLLVVDGVPSGGAFNPALATLDLHNVERIEVQRGAAPVLFGATSFVGVIQVIHYPAGSSDRRFSVGAGGPAGRYKSSVGYGSAVLSQGAIRQTISADLENRTLADPRAGFERAHTLYRAAAEVLGGNLHVDADLSLQNQTPTSAAPGKAGTSDGFDHSVKEDTNFNPSDARLKQQRYQFNLGYTRPFDFATWETTASYARSRGRNVQGYLAAYCAEHLQTNPNATPVPINSPTRQNACGYDQFTRISDVYADTHLVTALLPSLRVTGGVDFLGGRGTQDSHVFSYAVSPTDGGAGPSTGATPQETNNATDIRTFYGAYLQADWQPVPSIDVLGGLRYNRTHERLGGYALDTGDASSQGAFQEVPPLIGVQNTANPSAGLQTNSRPSGSLGLSWRFFQSGRNDLTAYTTYRNAFKPAAMDFGPDVEPSLLKPESSQSYEAGLKGDAFDGRVRGDLSVFYMKMKNIVVLQGNGMNPALANAGSVSFRGSEFELRYMMSRDLFAELTGAYHDIKYGQYVRGVFDPTQTDFFDQNGVDGRPPIRTRNVDDSGNRREFSPRVVSALGLIYAPINGPHAQATVNYTGRRYLDPENTVSAKGFFHLDTSAGYRYGGASVDFLVRNATNSRDAVSASEFIDNLYYRNPARTYELNVSVDYGRQ